MSEPTSSHVVAAEANPVPKSTIIRRGRGNFSTGLKCDSIISSGADILSSKTPLTKNDVLTSDGAFLDRDVPGASHPTTSNNNTAVPVQPVNDMSILRVDESRTGEKNEENLLIQGDTVREQLFRRERRRRYIVFIGNMYALSKKSDNGGCSIRLSSHTGPKPARLDKKFIQNLTIIAPAKTIREGTETLSANFSTENIDRIVNEASQKLKDAQGRLDDLLKRERCDSTAGLVNDSGNVIVVKKSSSIVPEINVRGKSSSEENGEINARKTIVGAIASTDVDTKDVNECIPFGELTENIKDIQSFLKNELEDGDKGHEASITIENKPVEGVSADETHYEPMRDESTCLRRVEDSIDESEAERLMRELEDAEYELACAVHERRSICQQRLLDDGNLHALTVGTPNDRDHLAVPVLTTARFEYLNEYFYRELLKLWKLEDIKTQKVTVNLQFGKAYYHKSGSGYHKGDKWGQRDGEGNRSQLLHFTQFVDSLAKETSQLFFVGDAPLTIARGLDVASVEGNCDRARYSLVKIFFFSRERQSHIVARAIWDNSCNSFTLVDIEHIGVTFSWLMLHLGDLPKEGEMKRKVAQSCAAAAANEENRDINENENRTTLTSTSSDILEDKRKEGLEEHVVYADDSESVNGEIDVDSDEGAIRSHKVTEVVDETTIDSRYALPVELQFRSFHRSKQIAGHPIEMRTNAILRKLTEAEHDRLKYGSSTYDTIDFGFTCLSYEDGSGNTVGDDWDDNNDEACHSRKYDKATIMEARRRRALAAEQYDLSSIIIEHIETRKLPNGIQLDTSDSLLIENFEALRAYATKNKECEAKQKAPRPFWVDEEIPENTTERTLKAGLLFFRSRSCNIHWKIDITRRSHEENLAPIKDALECCSKVIEWANVFENHRAGKAAAGLLAICSHKDNMWSERPPPAYRGGMKLPKYSRGDMGDSAAGNRGFGHHNLKHTGPFMTIDEQIKENEKKRQREIKSAHLSQQLGLCSNKETISYPRHGQRRGGMEGCGDDVSLENPNSTRRGRSQYIGRGRGRGRHRDPNEGDGNHRCGRGSSRRK